MSHGISLSFYYFIYTPLKIKANNKCPVHVEVEKRE